MIIRYLIPIVLLLISALIGILYIDPEYTRIGSMLSSEVQLDQDISDAKMVNAKLAELSDKYAQFPSDADARLRVLLPDTIHPVRAMIDARALVIANDLTPYELSVGEGITSEKDNASALDATAVNFTIETTYVHFKEFLHDLERGLLLREPTSIVVTTDDPLMRRSKTPLIVAQMQLTSYSMKKQP